MIIIVDELLYKNLLLTAYFATFLILLLCVKVPRNNGLLRVTPPLTAGHKRMLITGLINRFWYYTRLLFEVLV